MCLSASKRADETWRGCVERYAAPYGLEAECLEYFDAEIASGRSDEGRVAWEALYEWDLLDFE